MYIIKRDAFATHPLLSRLLELHDIPEQVHIEGTLPEITLDAYGRATPRILTIVGSRKHTTYANDAVAHLVSSLAGQPVIILSGLALGVDGLAHKEALIHGLTTLAMPGSGLNTSVIYPRAHLALSEEIVEKGGALISEFDPHTGPALWTFPARNRLMAALSDMVLIIEAEEKSGTLITARQALELGRDIGAVPGHIFSPTSIGTNMLIREGAYAITNEKDLFDLLHLSYSESEKELAYDLTQGENIIMNLLSESKEKDALLLESKLPLTEFLTLLSSLEMKGYIQETFGEVRRIV
jgi:DNA processing protein